MDKETQKLLRSLGLTAVDIASAKNYIKKGKGDLNGWLDKKANKGLLKAGYGRVKAAFEGGPEAIAAQQERVAQKRAKIKNVASALAAGAQSFASTQQAAISPYSPQHKKAAAGATGQGVYQQKDYLGVDSELNKSRAQTGVGAVQRNVVDRYGRKLGSVAVKGAKGALHETRMKTGVGQTDVELSNYKDKYGRKMKGPKKGFLKKKFNNILKKN